MSDTYKNNGDSNEWSGDFTYRDMLLERSFSWIMQRTSAKCCRRRLTECAATAAINLHRHRVYTSNSVLFPPLWPCTMQNSVKFGFTNIHIKLLIHCEVYKHKLVDLRQLSWQKTPKNDWYILHSPDRRKFSVHTLRSKTAHLSTMLMTLSFTAELKKWNPKTQHDTSYKTFPY